MVRMSVRPHRSHKSLLPAALVALGCTLGLGACMSELPPVDPSSSIGVVEGRVREGAFGVPAYVEFRDETGPLYTELRVTADSTGWYRAELPIGLYSTRVGFATSGTYFAADSDTILVGRCVRRRDFERARGHVVLTLPPAFDGMYARLNLAGARNRAAGEARVEDGLAVFDLRLMPRSSYVMRLSIGFDMAEFYLPSTYVSAEGDSLDATSGAAEYSVDLREHYASVSGRVTGSWQTSGDNMEVQVVTAGGRKISEVTCNDDGTYRVDLLVPEPVKIRTVCRYIENWYGGTSLAAATVFDLQPGLNVEGVDLSEGALNIRFDGPGDLVPSYHSIVLRREDGSEIPVRTYGNPIRVPNLPEGRYRLRVDGFCVDDPWQPQWYDGAADADGSVPLDVVVGATRELTMVLRSGGSILGRFEGETDTDWNSHAVYVHDGAGAQVCDEPLYMYYGAFSLAGLPDGDYCLSLGSRGQPYWYPGTFVLAEATRLTISGGNAITDLLWLRPGKAVGEER
jgi:hypothetical protein